MKVRRCHVCRCTELRACPGRCWWIGWDLCSSCGPAAARHLRERPLLRRPRRFYWTRHADIEMGFVRWSLRYVIDGQCFGSDICKGIDELQIDGRGEVAHQLRMARSQGRVHAAALRAAAKQRRQAP